MDDAASRSLGISGGMKIDGGKGKRRGGRMGVNMALRKSMSVSAIGISGDGGIDMNHGQRVVDTERKDLVDVEKMDIVRRRKVEERGRGRLARLLGLRTTNLVGTGGAVIERDTGLVDLDGRLV